MQPVDRHPFVPDASFDGGDLDCGNGLLLLIRQHMDGLDRGGLLEFRSTEISVEEDFPAWCRMTGNELVSCMKQGNQRSFLVCKGALADRRPRMAPPAQSRNGISRRVVEVTIPNALPYPPTLPSSVRCR
jgi:5-methyltetrahydropteroyltriglutamate--homocysteine methyltransferase